MKYTEFLHTIETEITARLDNNFKLTIHPVKKNNGMIYDGLVIINPKFNIAPTIYLNPYYDIKNAPVLRTKARKEETACNSSSFLSYCQFLVA